MVRKSHCVLNRSLSSDFIKMSLCTCTRGVHVYLYTKCIVHIEQCVAPCLSTMYKYCTYCFEQ